MNCFKDSFELYIIYMHSHGYHDITILLRMIDRRKELHFNEQMLRKELTNNMKQKQRKKSALACCSIGHNTYSRRKKAPNRVRRSIVKIGIGLASSLPRGEIDGVTEE